MTGLLSAVLARLFPGGGSSKLIKQAGQSYCDPKRFRAKAYPVNVEPGSNVVKGPYVAETLAASIESDYVVVDL